jgi:MFS family permease
MNNDPAPRPTAVFRSLGMTVYAPTVLFAIGQGAVVPVMALAARDAGASIPVAAVIVALRGVGAMVADIPAGMLIGRLGESRAVSVGTGVLILSLIGVISSSNTFGFGIFAFLMGCGWSVWLLARLAYVTDVAPIELRGRALSMLGGMNRIGNFVGPFIGALVIAFIGIDGAFYVHIVTAAAGWILLQVVPDPHTSQQPLSHVPVRFRLILADHAKVFATAGAAAISISLLRSTRQAVVPLWADQIGLEAALVAVIFGISSALDMVLFYPAGSASDRFGRKFVAIPCMVIMAAGFILLPMTSTFVEMLGIGLILGLGNGIGSGIVMTLGADFSPSHGRAEFLGVWRTVGDVGSTSGPLVASAVTALVSLAAGSVAVGAVGLLGAAVVLVGMPEPLRRHRETRRGGAYPGGTRSM